MQVVPIKTRIFRENEDVLEFIFQHVKALSEDCVLVVTSKIVALSEGRTENYTNLQEKIDLINKESDFLVETKHVWLTIKDGMVMANAGVDESNADGKLVLLPKDSFRSAEILRKVLLKKFKLKRFGVLITDSRTMPLRAGVIGVALGYAGFSGIKDYRGTPDIFGRKFQYSRTNVADGLAASAVLIMGEGREQQPLAVITGAPVKFQETVNPVELQIPIEDDMYRPLLPKLPKRRS